MSEQATYSNQVIEMADFIFAHPREKRNFVLGHFGTEWDNVPKSTMKKWYYKAIEYNKPRIKKQEKVKDNEIVSQAKESIKKAILSREESLEILSEIARGKNARQLKKDSQALIPSDGERVRALDVFFKAQGYYAPTKSDINIKRPILNISVIDAETGDEIEMLRKELGDGK